MVTNIHSLLNGRWFSINLTSILRYLQCNSFFINELNSLEQRSINGGLCALSLDDLIGIYNVSCLFNGGLVNHYASLCALSLLVFVLHLRIHFLFLNSTSACINIIMVIHNGFKLQQMIFQLSLYHYRPIPLRM